MRHLVKGKKLGRNAAQRKHLLRSLAISLIMEQRIKTTLSKAKELRTFVEPLITRAKEDTMHNRRTVFSKLNHKEAVTKLFDEIGPMAVDRPGGYTRVLKAGFRQGDAADMALIELVDFNDVKPEGTDKKRKKTRRSGRSSKKTSGMEGDESKSQKQQAQSQSQEKFKSESTSAQESTGDTTSDSEASSGDDSSKKET